MKIYNTKIFYSATDLVNFTQCEHRTTMDMMNLETPMEKAPDSEELEFIQNRGYDHEHDYVKQLKGRAGTVVEISTKNCGRDIASLDRAASETFEAMKKGVDIIYQAVLRNDCWYGYADFLRRVDRPSAMGEFSYEVMDTKLARTAKPAHIIQLCFYSDLLSHLQGIEPEMLCLVLGDKREENFRYADFSKYYGSIKKRFEEKIQSNNQDTSPAPCDLCDKCVWREICKQQWEESDHLCRVANITKIQINKLMDAGVHTLADLAQLSEDTRISKINPDTFKKIRHQAMLHIKKRKTKKIYMNFFRRTRKGFGVFSDCRSLMTGTFFSTWKGTLWNQAAWNICLDFIIKKAILINLNPSGAMIATEKRKPLKILWIL